MEADDLGGLADSTHGADDDASGSSTGQRGRLGIASDTPTAAAALCLDGPMGLAHGRTALDPPPGAPHVGLDGSDDALDLGHRQRGDAVHRVGSGPMVLPPVGGQAADVEHRLIPVALRGHDPRRDIRQTSRTSHRLDGGRIPQTGIG